MIEKHKYIDRKHVTRISIESFGQKCTLDKEHNFVCVRKNLSVAMSCLLLMHKKGDSNFIRYVTCVYLGV